MTSGLWGSIRIGLPALAKEMAPVLRFGACSAFTHVYSLHARQVAEATLYTRGSDDFVSSVAALIPNGWSEPDPGRDSHPLRTSAFHGAPQSCDT